MAERQWRPVNPTQTREWIANATNGRKADEFMAKEGGFIREFEGKFHGRDVTGLIEIEFPTLARASECLAWMGVANIATIRDAETRSPFIGAVIIHIRASELTD